MKNLTEQVQRMRKMMGVINEQYSNFGDYIKEVLQNPVEFLNKLKTDEQFKNAYTQSYKSNVKDNFLVMELAKFEAIMKHTPLKASIKDLDKNEYIKKHFDIKNMEEYRQIFQDMKLQKEKGINLRIFIEQVPLANFPNGNEIVECFNIAAGQTWFK